MLLLLQPFDFHNSKLLTCTITRIYWWVGSLIFLLLIDDLQTDCLIHEYVDDTTLTEIIYSRSDYANTQNFFYQLLSWSNDNDLSAIFTTRKPCCRKESTSRCRVVRLKFAIGISFRRSDEINILLVRNNFSSSLSLTYSGPFIRFDTSIQYNTIIRYKIILIYIRGHKEKIFI